MICALLADICKEIPGYDILSKIYPLDHEHEFREKMQRKTIRHIEPIIDLSEMETANMVRILELLSMRYLELLSEKLEGLEKEIYTRALLDMRAGDSSPERVKEAEVDVMKIVDRYGKLLVIGDQLTVCPF